MSDERFNLSKESLTTVETIVPTSILDLFLISKTPVERYLDEATTEEVVENYLASNPSIHPLLTTAIIDAGLEKLLQVPA